MAKLPFFPFYAERFIASTVHMSNEEIGAYARLLCLQWDRGVITDVEIEWVKNHDDGDPNGTLSTDRVITDKFGPVPGQSVSNGPGVGPVQNERMEEIRREATERHDKQIADGKRGAAVRWGGDNESMDTPLAPQWQPKPKPKPNGEDKGQTPFDRFWSVVHRKVKKGRALREFEKAVDRVAKRDEVTKCEAEDFIIDRMDVFSRSQQAHDEVAGLLHPSTWLRDDQFDDDENMWDGRESGRAPAPRKPKALTVDNMRFALIKKYKVQESREWDDEQIRREYGKRVAK